MQREEEGERKRVCERERERETDRKTDREREHCVHVSLWVRVYVYSVFDLKSSHDQGLWTFVGEHACVNKCVWVERKWQWRGWGEGGREGGYR